MRLENEKSQPLPLRTAHLQGQEDPVAANLRPDGQYLHILLDIMENILGPLHLWIPYGDDNVGISSEVAYQKSPKDNHISTLILSGMFAHNDQL